MIEEPALLTIRRDIRRPPPEKVAAFQNVPTGFVVDAMQGGGALAAAIKPLPMLDASSSIAGPALTAGCGPGDILATLASLRFIEPGDIVVAAFAGHQGCAAIGDSIAGMAKNAGAAGFVTDGPARDSKGILDTGLPLWCSGLTPASPHSTGPGTVGLAIQIGGQQVDAGDIIVADSDGVVVVPFEQIDVVIERLARISDIEAKRDAAVADGMQIPEDISALLESDAVRYVN
ncbi:MAG: RraA family protein [Rhizobiaceae bacterium]